MQVKYEEYNDMVHELSEGGFSAKQSETLVSLLARLFSQQSAFFERIRKEDKAEREQIRKEDKAERDRIRKEDRAERDLARKEDKDERTRLEALIMRTHRWVIMTLTTLLLSVLGAMIVYAFRFMD